MKQISIITVAMKLTLPVLAGLLIGCSCGGSDSNSDSNSTVISGYVVAAPVNGADVSVVDGNGNEVVKAVKTNADGKYTLVIPDGSQTQGLYIKSMNGDFKDEATNNDGTAGEMRAYVSANSLKNGAVVCVTPGSTIVANLVMDGMSMTDANAAFEGAFGYTPDLSVIPVNATDSQATATATDESKLAGLRAAAFSQLAMDLGLSQDDQFNMFVGLAQDLSDDSLNGEKDVDDIVIQSTNPLIGSKTLPADIQNRFSTALLNFHHHDIAMVDDKHGNDQTGLTSAQIGTVPFAMIALTDAYRVEYKHMQDMMSSKEGKTTFKLHITDLEGTDVPDLTPMIMPVMNMSAHGHSTPVTGVTYDGADGMYTATVYYLMSSMMGYWDLKVDVDGDMMTKTDVAHFHPEVMMSMGDTAMAKLSGVDDELMSMMTNDMEGRPYRIFKESLMASGDTYNFSVFIVAQESMMNFPALVSNLVLNEGNMMSQLAIDCPGIDVSISVNDGDWSSAVSDCTDGIWTIGGLTLNGDMGEQNQVKVRLTINGEVKTTDGFVQDAGVNDYQTFTVTPNPSMSMM